MDVHLYIQKSNCDCIALQPPGPSPLGGRSLELWCVSQMASPGVSKLCEHCLPSGHVYLSGAFDIDDLSYRKCV